MIDRTATSKLASKIQGTFNFRNYSESEATFLSHQGVSGKILIDRIKLNMGVNNDLSVFMQQTTLFLNECIPIFASNGLRRAGLRLVCLLPLSSLEDSVDGIARLVKIDTSLLDSVGKLEGMNLKLTTRTQELTTNISLTPGQIQDVSPSGTNTTSGMVIDVDVSCANKSLDFVPELFLNKAHNHITHNVYEYIEKLGGL
jgi:hypothetical protein